MARNLRALYFYVIPIIILVNLVTLYPLVFDLFMSFQSWDLSRSPPVFIGLENYARLFADARFLNSLAVTCVFVGGAVALELLLGLGIAMLLNRRDLRGVSIFRTAVTIPMMVADVAVGVIFGFYLYEYTFGLLNYMVGLLGIPPIAWIGDPISAMIAVILADVWRNTPFVVLLLIAGLQSLPRGPYEAAMIDGASRYRIFRQITVPMLLPIIGVVTILRVINAFQVFGLVYTSTRGGPGTATEIFTYYSFLNAFKYLQVGYAAASIFVLFIIVLAITLVLVKATRL